MKKILWFLMIVVIIYLGYLDRFLTEGPGNFSIIAYEFADKLTGLLILHTWFEAGILEKAYLHTYTDFAFMYLYTTLLCLHTRVQAGKEEPSPFASLLKANIWLAIIAGIADLTENMLMLHNFNTFLDRAQYIPTYFITVSKFVLITWVITCFLISLFRTGFSSRKL
ncbi:MAG: hypothetical protein EOP53_25525 [Sphingobacteriales bacterium]|nr:MAG: hypothetical protein EOP53_25525 [Sphingobacteriales bacterium]